MQSVVLFYVLFSRTKIFVITVRVNWCEYKCMCVYIHLCVYIYMYTCICMCVHVHVYICIYTYIQIDRYGSVKINQFIISHFCSEKNIVYQKGLVSSTEPLTNMLMKWSLPDESELQKFSITLAMPKDLSSLDPCIKMPLSESFCQILLHFPMLLVNSRLCHLH